MKKLLVVLSLIAMFAACGQKEEITPTEGTTPVTAEQTIEEKKVEETTPVVIEETVIEEVTLIENKASEAVEAVEKSVMADVAEATNGEVVVETPVVEETVVEEVVPIVEEKPAQ